MRIRTRFNLALLAVFIPGFILSVWVTHELLIENAKSEVLADAGLIMETAMSVRSYTIDEIKPHMNVELADEFLPQTVPAFAATEVFERLRQNYPDYSYREATLNPTNPRDKATEWEQYNVVYKFRSRNMQELEGERIGPDGKKYLYIARPIQITNQACLACHDTPKTAPPSLIAKYGDRHGFGWQLNEVVGAQIVTVPSELAIQNAQRAVWIVTGLILGIVVALFIVLNVVLHKVVIKPVQNVSYQSDQVSLGNLNIPEFENKGAEEIRQLHASFNRMRRSIEKAMHLLNMDATRK
jgi:protein-histidine pros-kinase